MNPLISVIVPVYKVEKYLDRCVESIVNQTYKNLEIILVDDGSPDNCPAMCDAWAEKDSRIRVIHKENGGVSSARNMGLDIATGDYIGFVDSDDYVSHQMLNAMLQNAIENCSDVVANLIDKKDNHASSNEVITKNEAVAELIKGEWFRPCVWAKLYKSSVIGTMRFDEHTAIGEDYYFNYLVFSKIDSLSTIDIEAYYYNIENEGSATATINKEWILRFKNTKRILQKEKGSELYGLCLRVYASELSCVTRELIRDGNAELVDICYPEIVSEVKNDFAEFESIKKEINKKVFASLKMMNRAPNMFLKAMRLYYKIRG